MNQLPLIDFSSILDSDDNEYDLSIHNHNYVTENSDEEVLLIEQLITALKNYNIQELDKILSNESKINTELINKSTKVKSKCKCGIDINNNNSGFLMLTSCMGNIPCSLDYLIRKKYIDIQTLVVLLYELLQSSGSASKTKYIANKTYMIYSILDHLLITDKYVLCDYRHAEMQVSLLHALLYGYEKQTHINRWFDMLISAGCNVLSTTIIEIYNNEYKDEYMDEYECKENYYEQTILELAINNNNIYIAKKCIDFGANINNYDIFNRWRGRNFLMQQLYSYKYEKSEEQLKIIFKMVEFLVEYGINLRHQDNTGLYIENYIYKFNWQDTDIGKYLLNLLIKRGYTIDIEQILKINDNIFYTKIMTNEYHTLLYDNRFIKDTNQFDNVYKICKQYVDSNIELCIDDNEDNESISDYIYDYYWQNTIVGKYLDQVIKDKENELYHITVDI
jgi:hypothetical protein